MNRAFSSSGLKNLARVPFSARTVGLGIRCESNGPQYKKKFYVDPDPQMGDYPNLPWIRGEEKTPYGWWDRQLRRNFGDTVHEHEDILGTQSNSVYYHPPWSKVLLQWAAFVAILGTGAFLASYTVPERTAIPRHYPYDGLDSETGGSSAITMQESIKSVMEK